MKSVILMVSLIASSLSSNGFAAALPCAEAARLPGHERSECVTPRGYLYRWARDASSGLSGWQDHLSGLLWTQPKRVDLGYAKAEEFCAAIPGGRLPTLNDLSTADLHQIARVYPDMKGRYFWAQTSTLTSRCGSDECAIVSSPGLEDGQTHMTSPIDSGTVMDPESMIHVTAFMYARCVIEL